MKKSTLEAIRNYLNGDTNVDIETLRTEVNDEYTRLNAKAAANADIYAQACPAILAAITDEPQTDEAIYESCKDELPEGFTRAKVRYALLHQLAEQVDKIQNGKNPNTYKKKA